MKVEVHEFASDTHHRVFLFQSEQGHLACLAVYNKLHQNICSVYYTLGDMKKLTVKALQESESMYCKNAITGDPQYGAAALVVNLPEDHEDAVDFAETVFEKMNEDMDMQGFYTGQYGNLNCNNHIDRYQVETVFQSLLEVYNFGVESDETPQDFTVNIYGMNTVGRYLATKCMDYGFDLCIADADFEYARGLAEIYGCAVSYKEEIHRLEGTYVPCTKDVVIDEEFLSEAKDLVAIVPGTDNVLSKMEIGTILATSGILYVPDFIATSGSLIYYKCYLDEKYGDEFHARLEFVSEQVKAMLLAQTVNFTTTRNAQYIAEQAAKAVSEKEDNEDVTE